MNRIRPILGFQALFVSLCFFVSCSSSDEGTKCGMSYTDYGDGQCRPADPCASDRDCLAGHRLCVNNQGIAECGNCAFETCLDVCCEEGEVCRWNDICGPGEYKSTLGSTVSISGDWAIIGNPVYSEPGNDENLPTGAAYMFKFAHGQWIMQQKLFASDPQYNDFFGWVVSISGGVAVVVAPGFYPHLTTVGVYIFELEGENWLEKAKITEHLPTYDFGWSVSVSEDFIIVGEPAAGAAYIFEKSQGQWSAKQMLTASDSNVRDTFGWSVSISGDVAIVGAPIFGNPGIPEGGAAYIFQLEDGNWEEKQKLHASDAQMGDEFGVSVSISDNVAIVGAYRDDGCEGDPLDNAGAAYVFQLVDGEWVEHQKLTASDAQASDNFGYSVSTSGDVAIVGAWSEDGGEGDPLDNAGAAYIYQLQNERWVEKEKLTHSDAQAGVSFGYYVSVSENFAIVGSHGLGAAIY